MLQPFLNYHPAPMGPTTPVGAIALLLVLCAAVVSAGCGGRTVARPEISPEEAVRLDRAAEPPAESDAPAERRGPPPAPAARTPRPSSGPAGITHPLQRGETLYSLARAYGVPLADVMRVNGIADPSAIRAGTPIFIPFGEPAPDARPARLARPRAAGRGAGDAPVEASIAGLPPPGDLPMPGAPMPGGDRPMPGDRLPSQVTPGGPSDLIRIDWPLQGRINSGFGRRGTRSFHEGVDIDGNRGDPIRAAADGVVLHAGHGGRYGRYLVIDHGDGVITLYAHADRLLVGQGDRVERGDLIAAVGRTGNARGTHLHFEVRRNGHPVDPLPLLRGGAVAASNN
jgi:lipoprotein NlpD